MRAHPRSRGENEAHCLVPSGVYGSSPLTRGKHRRDERSDDVSGLIPAHAGKTPASVATSTDRRAHPRSRGENVSWTRPASPTRGSSPLTRGKPVHEVPEDFASGLIPAHAGKTADRAGNETVDRAHPRSRGENSLSLYIVDGGSGSSPLTRGKLTRPGPRRDSPRLIPAHAGKTCPCPASRSPSAAHPRSRGENARTDGNGHRRCGSSPLTRGKPTESPRVSPLLRLIPAHAGKTTSTSSQASYAPAHPRSRGENTGKLMNGVTQRGSSPLTRGKRTERRQILRRRRLIPAHAGKTVNTQAPRISVPAHPRSRGENGPQRTPGERSGGSSPLTRGKQPLRAPRWRRRRLIPAHAGKTTASRLSYLTGTAHPRSRGENGKAYLNLAVHAGSSPLTRGKRREPDLPG